MGCRVGKIGSRRITSEDSSQLKGTANEEMEMTKNGGMKRNRKHTRFQQITAHDGDALGV
jgi:hypothetical protein